MIPSDYSTGSSNAMDKEESEQGKNTKMKEEVWSDDEESSEEDQEEFSENDEE